MSEWMFRCPHGHASIQMGADRIYCTACGKADQQATHAKEDMIRLRSPGASNVSLGYVWSPSHGTSP